MMRWIVGSSLKLRRVVVVVAAALMVAGFMQLGDTPVDTLPEFAQPTVEVQTEALGLSAVEVEQLITVPLEQDLLNGIAFLETIRSESVPSLSSIELVFEPGTDLLRARQLVQERLTEAHALPNVSKPPTMLQPVSSSRRVMMIGMSSQELSLIEMSLLARWTIKPRLQGVAGVANVAVWGHRERQLQVRVDPSRLRANGVTLPEVVDTTGNALWVSPLTFLEASTPGTGGFIDTPNQRLLIQHLLPVKTADDLARVAITTRNGRTALRLGDVATVVEDHQPLIGDAALPGGAGLLLVVEKFPETDTLKVTQDVEEALAGLGPGLSDVRFDTSIYRPADYVRRSIDNVAIALIIGAILLMLVLGAFFWDWRPVVVSGITMAAAAAAALVVLRLRDTTVNSIVIAGLGMALIAIVHDAVSGTDAVLRRLRDRTKDRSSRSIILDVLDATLESRGSLLFATAIIGVAVIPLLFLGGVAGAFYPALVASYLLAILASMVVALTVTPALGMLLLAGDRLDRPEPPLVRKLHGVSDRLVAPLTARPMRAVLAVGLIAAAGLAMLPIIRRGPVLPTFREPVLLVDIDAAPGTSPVEMTRIVAKAGSELRSLPGVRSVGAYVGRAVTSDRIVGINTAEILVAINPQADYEATLTGIRRVMAAYPGIDQDVLIYSNERVTDLLTGIENDVVVRLFGEDLTVLTTKAQEVQGMLAGIDGVTQPVADIPLQEPTLEIEVNLTAAQRHGIKPGDVRRAATTLLSGLEVGQLFDDNKIFEVVVWATPEVRSSIEAVRRLLIDTPEGGQVRLSEVAQVRIAPNPTVIAREAVSRSIDVMANVRGRSLGAVTDDVEAGMARIDFPLDYHAELLQDAAERVAEGRRVVASAIAAAIGILLLLQATFGSWRLAILLFLTLPAAVAGGLVGAAVGDRAVSIGTVGGVIAVLFVTVRNGILLFRRYRHLERLEGADTGSPMILRGVRDRITPTIISALATFAVLLPVLVRGVRPGTEILHPMAVVVAGGLVSSTLVTTVLLPALYLRFRGEPGTRTVDDDVELIRTRVIVLDDEEPVGAGRAVAATATDPQGTS
ncbi:MAG: efflux RND transporter permease subunit [Actinomycetota bacterium]